ncbi:phage portal protein [Escherichia coli]|nr:phage portal protein [Escherichia coli]
MTERELSIIRALGEEFSTVLADLQRTFEGKMASQAQAFEEKLTSLSAVLQKHVTVDEVRPVLQAMVDDAVGAIPVPRDGRDYDPDVLQKAVLDAVSALPAPQDGRDATALEILPAIDDQKSFPRGTYATHQGGLWRAYEKTHGMRGWECLVDGVADIDVSMTGERLFSVVVRQSSGQRTEKTFSLPVMLYRGVFRAGETYHPGDTVTWGGSLWHCNSMTEDKPGEAHSSAWTLAAKRGRDARGGK